MKKIILAGGTGALGKLLTDAFINSGWHVVILTRRITIPNTSDITWVRWDGANLGDWSTYLEGADAVINLSGKSIQCRFTEDNQKELYDSRILPTKVLGKAIEQLNDKPNLWINFSGVSIFNQLDVLQDENSKEIGKGFLASLTEAWERAFWDANLSDVQQVVLRVSPVLLKDSGFFAELLPLVKMGLGGHVADGKQWINWIHYTDLVNLIFWIIQHEKPAPIYHACSPSPSSNAIFMKTFRSVVGIPIGFPLPTMMAKIGAFAKGVDASLLLDSTPVTTSATVEDGFVFQYPNAEVAIKQLLNKST